MNPSSYISHQIHLRKTTAKDLAWVREVENNSQNAPYICQWTYEQHLKALDDPDIAHFIILSNQDNRRVGYVILTGCHNPHHSLCLYRLVINEKGKGFGRDLLRLVKQHAFTQYKAHRLWLDVFEGNDRARLHYLSEGFTEEGMLREAIKVENGYKTITIMSILEQEYSKV